MKIGANEESGEDTSCCGLEGFHLCVAATGPVLIIGVDEHRTSDISNRNLIPHSSGKPPETAYLSQYHPISLPEIDHTARNKPGQTYLPAYFNRKHRIRAHYPPEAGSLKTHPTSISGTSSCHGMQSASGSHHHREGSQAEPQIG